MSMARGQKRKAKEPEIVSNDLEAAVGSPENEPKTSLEGEALAPEGETERDQDLSSEQEGDVLDVGGTGLVRRGSVTLADGESEWVAPNVVGPDDLIEGAVVHVRRRWDPPDWVRGRVRGRVGEAFEVELDDGGFAWTTLMRLRAPIEQAAAPPPSPDPPADAAE